MLGFHQSKYDFEEHVTYLQVRAGNYVAKLTPSWKWANTAFQNVPDLRATIASNPDIQGELMFEARW